MGRGGGLREEAETVGSGCALPGMRVFREGAVCAAHPETGVPGISDVRKGEGEWAPGHGALPSPLRVRSWELGVVIGSKGEQGGPCENLGLGWGKRGHRLCKLNFFGDLWMGWWDESKTLEKRPPPSSILL